MDKDLKSLKYPLLILSHLEFYAVKNHWRNKIAGTFYLVLLGFNILVTILQGPLMERNNIFEFVAILEGACVFGQYFGKVLVMLLNQKAFLNLIRHTQLCWKTNRCTGKWKEELDDFGNRNLRLQMTFLVSACICMVAMSMSGLYGKELPLGIWKMHGKRTLYAIFYFTQVLSLVLFTFFTMSVDSIFPSCCAELIVQCRILQQNLKNLDISVVKSKRSQQQYHRKMFEYIAHHDFVLRFLNAFQDFYSFIAIVEYGSIAPIICLQMYAINQSFSVSALINHGIVFVTAVLQLAIYSIPTDYVADEAVQVSFALYDSNWYANYFRELRTPVISVIQRCNKEIVFSASGLFDVNARSLLSVLRISWSACMLLSALNSSKGANN